MILLSLLMALFVSAKAQNQTKDEIKLVTTGEASTKNEAVKLALRSAIEQAYGAFVSANTTILNDDVVKDEIATIASGNIKSYQEIASVIMPNGNTEVTLSVTVSLGKLISYAKSHGSSAEFAGSMFASNMKMRELNHENEKIVLDNLLATLTELSKNMFDYDVHVNKEPKKVNTNQEGEYYAFEVTIDYLATETSKSFMNTLLDVLSSISLSEEERKTYKEVNEEYYTLILTDMSKIKKHSNVTGFSAAPDVFEYDKESTKVFYLRNQLSFFAEQMCILTWSALCDFVLVFEGINEIYNSSKPAEYSDESAVMIKDYYYGFGRTLVFSPSIRQELAILAPTSRILQIGYCPPHYQPSESSFEGVLPKPLTYSLHQYQYTMIDAFPSKKVFYYLAFENNQKYLTGGTISSIKCVIPVRKDKLERITGISVGKTYEDILQNKNKPENVSEAANANAKGSLNEEPQNKEKPKKSFGKKLTSLVADITGVFIALVILFNLDYFVDLLPN